MDAVDFRAIEVAVQPPMPPRVPRRLWNAATLCIAVASIVTASGVANAAIKFSIFYVVVQVEVSPHQETHRFNGARKIVINKNGDLQAGDKKRHLGVETSDIDKSNNETYYVAYKVDKDGILITNRYPGFGSITKVTTNGKDSCAAEITYSKINGHEYFEGAKNWNKEHMLMSDMHAEAISCTVAEVPD